ncbi:MAG: hypothetical protein KDK07_01905 [Bauldia sp.]|nr:hypothetical protein [Bauldia sp.]
MPVRRTATFKTELELPPRQRLLAAVCHGDLTPAAAEVEAERLHLRPLLHQPDPTAFDPMSQDRWTLPMTIAWIVWRTPEAVRESWDAYIIGYERWREVFRDGRCVGFEPGPLPNPTWPVLALNENYPRERSREAPWRPRSPHDALEELWKALQQGDIEADAIDLDTKQNVEIQASAWKNLELYFEFGTDVAKEDALSRSGFRDIRFPMCQIIDAWPDRILPETLPPLMAPEGPGYMPLSAAAQWIATKGGAHDPGADFVAWDDAYLRLTDRIASRDVAVTGKEFRSGRSEPLDPALFSDLVVHHLFSSEEVDHADNDELYLWATPYVDKQHWRAKFSDDLRQRRKTIWSKLVVSRADVATWWPFDLGSDGPPRTGAPGRPTSMSVIIEEFDARVTRGEAIRSVGGEAKVLHAWFVKTHPSWSPPTLKTIANRLREQRREYFPPTRN